MSSSEHSKAQQDTSGRRDAVADMQERLAQFGRLVGQVRDGLPEQHAEALNRIEQGIAGLSERFATFEQDGQRRARTAATSPSAVQADAGEQWDPQSAEELMRAYEMAEAEFSRAEQQRPPRYREWPKATEAAGSLAAPPHDQAWLEARIADISTLLQRSLADIDPATSLAAFDRRLDLFERRLDNALSDMALGADRDRLKVIDGHLTELVEHFGTIKQQLARLDAMDCQLRELAQALEGHQQHPSADAAALNEDAIVALIDAAAERAASRLAASTPTGGGSQARIDALEGLLGDYIAERRGSEEATAGILRTIEDALVRIIDRVELMDGAKLQTAPAASDAGGDVADRDGMEPETDRLAEAYAAGARVLGQQVLEPSLDAADYVTAHAREVHESPAEVSAPASLDDLAAPEEQMRQELRASAMRAKLKAQATPHEPSAESAGLDEANAGVLGQGRARAWTSAKAGSHRFSLLLGVAMALLFGAGFVAVDSFLANAPSADAQPKAGAEQTPGERARGVATSGPQQGSLDPQPAAEAGKPDLAPRSWEQKVEPAQIPQPEPKAATEDLDPAQPAPTRRLNRLQMGVAATPSTGATPVMLSPQGEAGISPAENDGARGTVDGEIPPVVGTPKLRQAAAAGDAFAQFEIATRFAEGKGVAQDHKRAFLWYERAAMRGLAPAQFRLAAYFERGIGVAADRERAKVWYGRAAEQGYVRAMHNLGVLTVGTGEHQADYASAAGWFRQAADRGLADSQFNLAILYENGRGVPKDLQEAYKWFALAARAGDPAAARRLEQVKARLDPAELDSAEQRLTAWQPSPVDPIANAPSVGASR